MGLYRDNEKENGSYYGGCLKHKIFHTDPNKHGLQPMNAFKCISVRFCDPVIPI